ncbi:MAG TPA: hypothetical protein VFX74_01095 [Candidatus Limnocylindria bacterium]|nr:hypothetical protein [Candidatus Limnocylindria bacterium]
MGPILDLAVIALSVLVCGSLGLLAWTLGVTGVQAVRLERARVADARARLAAVHRSLPEQMAAIDEVVVQGSRRLKGDQ